MSDLSGYYKINIRHDDHSLAAYSHKPYTSLIMRVEYTPSIKVYKISILNPHSIDWVFGDLTTHFNLNTIGDSIRKIYHLFTDIYIENIYPVNEEFVILETSFY